MKLNKFSVVMLTLVLASAGYAHSAIFGDVFTGTFISETPDNFGPREETGEIKVKIAKNAEKYHISVFYKGVLKYELDAISCEIEPHGFLKDRPAGQTYALCTTTTGSNTFVYSENGIFAPLDKRHHLTKYYGYIQWSVWGFRKIE